MNTNNQLCKTYIPKKIDKINISAPRKTKLAIEDNKKKFKLYGSALVTVVASSIILLSLPSSPQSRWFSFFSPPTPSSVTGWEFILDALSVANI